VERRFENDRRNVERDPFVFSDNVFQIIPTEGVVWPKSSTEVNVIFSPDVAGLTSKIAYCEVSGRESRLPLQIKVYYQISQ
jgi:hydrocephalus-inducing protein